MDPNDTNINSIGNIDEVLNKQILKFNELRSRVKELRFVPIDPVGDYQAVTYKAIDGGKMNISFDPLEIDLIEVADSYGNLKMKFLFPRGSEEVSIDNDIKYLDNEPTVAKFLNLLGKKSLKEISEILTDPGTFMEISEWACLFEKIMEQEDEPLIIMRDGLLRTKKLKSELIPVLIDVLRGKRKYVKLVGVSKTSKIVSLLSAALSIEHVIPSNRMGYVKVPKDLELRAYNWTGKGKINDKSREIYYAFGDIYIAKLSIDSSLLVTVEIPRDLKKGEDIYTERDITRIMGHLAKDSAHSYPVIGYPQTIMRAHEAAARVGFPAGIIKDKILQRIVTMMDDNVKEFITNSTILNEFVHKGVLGGGHGE
jgi:hypothetical protein